MPAKRRRASKKKKEKKTAPAVIPNGNGEVKVIESDGGENSSPASQDLEVQQNPFTKDEDNKKPSFQRETEENENAKMFNGDGDVVVIEVMSGNENDDDNVKAGVSHGSLMKSANGSSRRKSVHGADVDGSHVDGVKEHVEEASHVKEAIYVAPVVEFESNGVVLDQVNLEPESVALAVQKSVGSTVAIQKSEKDEEKLHPSEIIFYLKAESPLSSGTDFRETSRDFFAKQLPQSNILIGNGESHVGIGSLDNQQSPEKEPLLLPALGPANKTSWIGCCGLLELFAGSNK